MKIVCRGLSQTDTIGEQYRETLFPFHRRKSLISVIFQSVGDFTMKLNKGFWRSMAALRLFFVLATLYVCLVKENEQVGCGDYFSLASTICASFAVLYESQRTKIPAKCTDDDATATFYVP